MVPALLRNVLGRSRFEIEESHGGKDRLAALGESKRASMAMLEADRGRLDAAWQRPG